MAIGNRQTNLFAAEDWKKLYTTFSEADFQSYDFETIRKVMVDYLKTYYSEDFNDFTESSEYIALLDLIAFVAQGLAFRTDLNARENFLETAERRDSVIKLTKQLNYNPNRNKAASGLLKIVSVSTTEQIISSTGQNLSNININWNDIGNVNWLNQFNQIMNSAFNSSQKIGKPYASKTINEIVTEQYNINVPTTVVPVFAYTAPVLEANAPFEIVSASILNGDTISEQDPGVRGQFGIVYQKDGKGYASNTNGFFLLFKQGQLQSLDFSINEKLPNRIVEIPVDNINNSDTWLYELSNGRIGAQWVKVLGTSGSNTVYNSTAKGLRNLYSINTRVNDQIDIAFGDGTFSNIPQGTYRSYFRVSNGITYRIAPADMSNIAIAVPYISKTGRAETLTIISGLQYTVANSSRRDLIDEIKAKAPQNYYTQNRMVNGEDYNIFPYTRYPDIVKVKSVNRFSSGISRGLDILDPTGRYSSTDLLSDDGAIYKEDLTKNITFSFSNRNEVTAAIRNIISPILKFASTKHFYYEKYPVTNLAVIPTDWERTTSDTSSCTGFFTNLVGDRQLVGEFTSSLRKFLLRNSLIKFQAPTGYYFDINNALIEGVPVIASDKTYIWASIQSQTGNGTNDIFFNGRQIGAITLTENIPSGALVTEVYAPLATVFSNSLVVTMANLIFNNINFGLRFDYASTATANDPWKIVSASNINTSGEFSLTNTGNVSGNNLDSSWLIRCETDGTTYTITYRGLNYIFSSLEKIRFLNSNNVRTYDSRTNTVVKDNIKLLNVNTKFNTTDKLDREIYFEILQNLEEADGYVDTTKVLITFTDADDNNIIDDPTGFSQLSTSDIKNVFFQRYYDFDNLERYQLLTQGIVNNQFPTLSSIELQRNNYEIGKVFYAYTDDQFYTLATINGIKTVVGTNEYTGYKGRQSLYFQYKHNANDSKRIDPATSNLIDIFILTRNYDEQYRAYITNPNTAAVVPEAPSSFELTNDYKDLFEYKMLTDSIVINNGKYKPLFGAKASSNLQAKFQAVKNPNTTISDNELKSQIVRAINEYFALENWDFGDTFYFSELSAYLHNELQGYLSSIILIPNDLSAVFGSLYEIRSQPNELFISAATVDNVEIVDSVLSGINTSGINTSTVTAIRTGVSTSRSQRLQPTTLTNSSSINTSGGSTGSSSSSGGGGYY